jgi:hypothetical protein
MNKIRLFILLLIVPLLSIYASEDVFFNIGTDVSTSYVFRGILPAGKQASIDLNFSAFFSNTNLNFSQWFVNSLNDPSDFHESGSMLSYYHYFNDRLIASVGLCLYLYPDVEQTPLANIEASFTFADISFLIPYFIETYFDFVLKSWYTKASMGYTIDTFLPINLTLSGGLNLLAYDRYGITVPTGFSDISFQISTYISLKNWQITPKFSLIALNENIDPKIIPQANVNLSYSF